MKLGIASLLSKPCSTRPFSDSSPHQRCRLKDRDHGSRASSTEVEVSGVCYWALRPLRGTDSVNSYTGIALVALHASSAIYFALRVARSLTHSYKSLSPAQDVRLRQDRRRKLVPLFSGLALLSLGTAVYSAYTYTELSYRVWADARGYLPKPSARYVGLLQFQE